MLDRYRSVSGERAAGWTAPMAVAAYMAASMTMLVANKQAVGALHAGTVLLALQQIFTCLAILALRLARVVRLDFNWPDVLRWTPVGILSGMVLWACMQAVKRASLVTLTVVRNVNPLFLLFAEWYAFGLRPGRGAVASLVVILVGICLYTWDDLQDSKTDPMGVVFILIDACLVCMESLLERYLLAVRPVELSLAMCVLIANAVGLVPVSILLLGPCYPEWSELKIDTPGVIWGSLTMPCGVGLAFMGVLLRCIVSATGALVVSNVDKVLILLCGIVFMGDRLDVYKGLGCLLALVGGVWHAIARRTPSESGPLESLGPPSTSMTDFRGPSPVASKSAPWPASCDLSNELIT